MTAPAPHAAEDERLIKDYGVWLTLYAEATDAGDRETYRAGAAAARAALLAHIGGLRRERDAAPPHDPEVRLIVAFAGDVIRMIRDDRQFASWDVTSTALRLGMANITERVVGDDIEEWHVPTQAGDRAIAVLEAMEHEALNRMRDTVAADAPAPDAR